MKTIIMAAVLAVATGCVVRSQPAPPDPTAGCQPQTMYARPDIGQGACGSLVAPGSDWTVVAAPGGLGSLDDATAAHACSWSCQEGSVDALCGPYEVQAWPGGLFVVTSPHGTCTTAWSTEAF